MDLNLPEAEGPTALSATISTARTAQLTVATGPRSKDNYTYCYCNTVVRP